MNIRIMILLLVTLASQLRVTTQFVSSSAGIIPPLPMTKCSNVDSTTTTPPKQRPAFVLLDSSSSASTDSEMCNDSTMAQIPPTTTAQEREEQKSRNKDQDEELPIFQEILGPFQPHYFRNHWTKHPLLIRKAFPPNTTSSWPTIQEIVTLASEEEDAEVRLITQTSSSHYELTIGYDPTIAQDAPKGNSTTTPSVILLINDVDRFHPTLSDWISQTFSFIPTWRMDDGQMSYSKTKGATIGRHVDNYDVFLIQTNGMKEWRIGKSFVSPKEEMERLIPNMDVRVLRPLDGEEEDERILTVYPGDVLYLPPRISHMGTALTEDCCTLSVGCRAPSASDLLTHLLADEQILSSSMKLMTRYQDPGNVQQLIRSRTEPSKVGRGQITREAHQNSKQLIMDAIHDLLDSDMDRWDAWFGKYVTQPKRYRNHYPIPLEENVPGVDPEWISHLGIWGDPKRTVQAIVNGTGCLYQAEGIVFAYSREGTTAHRLFVHGQVWEVSDPRIPIDILANERRLTIDLFPNGRICATTQALVEDLLRKGFLYGADE